MPLINVKNGEVEVSPSDLRYVLVQDIVPGNRLPSINLSEYQVTTFGGRRGAMAEKAGAKKDQQKNKKSKQNEKKKNQENGLKHMNEQHVHETNHVNHKKKDKSNNNNKISNKNNSKSAPNKKKSVEDSLLKRYLQLFLISTGYLFLAAGFLYLVDYDKYIKVREGGIAVLNKTLSFLPEEVVHKGKAILIPIAEGIVRRLNLLINETSTFLNTNPVTKDHWNNLREIGTMCGGCLVEYLRTLYNHVTQYWCDAKAKLF